MTKSERIGALYVRLSEYGFTIGEIGQLLKIEKTLHRWAEAECNGTIQRDDTTGKPFGYRSGRYLDPNDPRQYFTVRDRGAAALKKLAAIMESHKPYIAHHQGDPRGCALYIVSKIALDGKDINCCYNRGIAVCS